MLKPSHRTQADAVAFRLPSVWAGRSIGFRAFPYYHLVTPDLRSLSKVKRRKFFCFQVFAGNASKDVNPQCGK
jgi:hypothetical protein